MSDVLHLAWRYLLFNWMKTLIMIAVVSVIIFLPLALELVLDRSAARLTARAQATPLLLGAKGSPLDLVLSSLYFDGGSPAPTTYAALQSTLASGLVSPIPLYLRFRAGGQPIVGTSIDYFDFRRLSTDRGRMLAFLGEAVLGSHAAQRLGAEPGDAVVTSPETVFDVTGTYPLKLNVVGVLEPSGTADDEAVFVDVRTAWVIGGIGHGHDDLTRPESAAGVLRREGDTVVANASVLQYREITTANLSDFHFHGDSDSYPLTSVLLVPKDVKSGVLLEGRFQDTTSGLQVVQPSLVMKTLLETVFTVRQYVLIAVILVATTTVVTMALVFTLSLRLRRGEIETMMRIGAAPGRVVAILGTEVLLVLLVGGAAAIVLTGLANAFGDELLRILLMSGSR